MAPDKDSAHSKRKALAKLFHVRSSRENTDKPVSNPPATSLAVSSTGSVTYTPSAPATNFDPTTKSPSEIHVTGLDTPGKDIQDPIKTDIPPSHTDVDRDAPPAYSLRPVDDPTRDRQRTTKRYNKAVNDFKETMKIAKSHWKTIRIPDFDIGKEDPTPLLRDEIMDTLETREKAKKSNVEKGFSAISPFLSNILTIAKESSAV